MITQERIFEEIKNITETNLKNLVIHELKTSGKDMTEDNFEFFLDYLKEVKKEYLYADFIRQYLCKESYKNAKLFLTKLIGCFRIKNVNLNKTLKLIRDNANCILKRCSGWNDLEIPIISDSSDVVNIKCSAAEYKYINN
jgi:hypothetical protein